MKNAPLFSQLRPIPAAIVACFGTAAAMLLPETVFANPSGGVVVGGQATITTPSANGTVINQTSNSTIINWNQFNIGSGQYVQFIQPSSSSIALNRVIGGSPSAIFGSLEANGRVFLVNPNGVLFAPGAMVDVGGLLATTMDIKNADFMAGNYVFSGAGEPGAAVVNAGKITAGNGGFVVLAGDTVANSGIIQAQLGQVVLASGSATTLDIDGSGISYSIDKAALSAHAGVTNTGELIADGGRVIMAASTARALVGTAVNNSGIVRAQGIAEHNGEIELTASGGDISNTGTLDASNAGGQGGTIKVTGDRDISIGDGGTLLADGETGGSISVVADNSLELLAGSLVSATGSQGNAGEAELSGHGLLKIRGDITLGKGGTLLLDPTTITIGTGSNFSYGGAETISQSTLESELQSGTDVDLIASNSISINALSGNLLDGQNSNGTGGSLLLGIGTGTTSANFVQSTGGGFITSLAANSIALDGNLIVDSGTGSGTITLGALKGSSVELDAGGAISVSGAITATDHAEIISLGGAINTGDITVTSTTANTLNSDDTQAILVEAEGSGAGAMVLGTLKADTSGYGGTSGIQVSNEGGTLQIASVEASNSTGEEQVNIFSSGNLHITGGLNVSGGGGSSTFGPAVFLTSGGSVTVDGATLVVGHAGFQGSSSYGGRISDTVEGDGQLRVSAGTTLTMGSVAVSGVGDAEFSADAATALTFKGAISVTATHSDSSVLNADQSRNSAYGGMASIQLTTDTGNGVGGPTDTTSITTAGITASGPTTLVSLSAGSLNLGAGASGNAIDATAVPDTSTYQASTAEGTPVVNTNFGNAEVELFGRGSAAGGPGITTAGISVTGPAAELDIEAAGKVAVNGSLSVAGTGFTVTGDATQVPDFEAQNRSLVRADAFSSGESSEAGDLAPPILLNGTTTWGAGLLTIAGYPTGNGSTQTTLPVGAVTVTGNVSVSGVGQADLNVKSASFNTGGNVQVSATQGTLQGIAVATVVTSGSSDSAAGSSGYVVTRTIGDGSDGAATFGRASAQIATSGNVQVGSLALTGLSAQATITATNITATGGIAVIGTGTPTFVESDTYKPFGTAQTLMPTTGGTSWTGDINELEITATGAVNTGDLTLVGSGITNLSVSGASVAVGNVVMTQTPGLFISNDPTRTSASYSYQNPASELSIGSTSGTATATSVTSTTTGFLALGLVANVSGAVNISTLGFADTLPGIGAIQHPILQGNPTAPATTGPIDADFNENLDVSAGSATLILGQDATLRQVALTTTGALDIVSGYGGEIGYGGGTPVNLTLGNDTVLTGGSIDSSTVNLIAPNLELTSTSGDITTADISAQRLIVSSQGAITTGNLNTLAVASGTGGSADASITLTANTGAITTGNIITSATAAGANASVTMTAAGNIQTGTITTTANENSTDLTDAGQINNSDADIAITSGGGITLVGAASTTVTTSASGPVDGTIALSAGGGDIVTNSLTTSMGAISLTDTGGNISTGDLTTTVSFGDITAASNGWISVGNLSTFGGAVNLSAGAANAATGDGILTGSITTVTNPGSSVRDASVTLATTTGDLVVGGPISATADSTNSDVVANADVTLTDLSGQIFAGTITASAAGPSAGLQTSDVTLSGTTGVSVTSITTGGAISATSSAGNTEFTGALTAGSNITLVAAGAIDVGGLTELGSAANNGALGVTAGTGVTMGDIFYAGPIGAIGLANDMYISSAAGNIVIGNVGIPATGTTSLNILASNGDITTGGLNVERVNLEATAAGGTITTGNLNLFSLTPSLASDSQLNAGGTVKVGTVATDGGLSSTAGTTLTIGAITATGNVALTAAAGDVDASDVSGGNVTLKASGTILAGTITATGGANITAGTGTLAFGDVTGGGAVSITDTSGNLDLEQVTGGSVTLIAGGTLDAGTVTATAGTVNATAGGASLQLGDVNAPGDVTIADGGGNLMLAQVVGADVALSAGGTLAAGIVNATSGTVNASAGGSSLQLGNITASGNITVTDTAGDVTLGGVDGDQVNLTAGGKLVTGTIDAGNVTATAGGSLLQTGSIESSGLVSLTAASGALELASISGDSIALSTGRDFTYGSTMSASTTLQVTSGGAITLNEASLFGGTITLTSAGTLGINNSYVGIPEDSEGLILARADAPLSDTVELRSTSGDVDMTTATLNSGRIDVEGTNIDVAKSSNITGTQVALTATGLVSAGAVTSVADASTITAGALSVKANQIDLTDSVMTIGTGLADFGTDTGLIAGLSKQAPDLVPASAGPNASFSAPEGVLLGNISIAGGYLYVQTSTLALPTPTGANGIFINFVPTDGTADLTVTSPAAITPPAGITTLAIGGTGQTGNIQFGDGTQHFDILPLNTNFVLDTAGTVFFPDAIQTGGRVIVLGSFVNLPSDGGGSGGSTVSLPPLDGVPFTEDLYRTEYVSPVLERLPDFGSLIDIVTSTGAEVCGAGGGQ